MNLETDLAKIKRLAARNDDENWQFRTFLKGYPGSEEELDSLVHELYRTISAEIDCRQCGNCCRVIKPALDQQDILSFSGGLGMPVEKFKRQYLLPDESDPEKYLINRLPCPFLKGNQCLSYALRPQDCRSFPHLDKPDFTHRLIGVIQNYAICPRVFNVYENLKIKLQGEYNDYCRDAF